MHDVRRFSCLWGYLLWVPIGIYEFACVCVCRWVFMGTYGCLWVFGCLWILYLNNKNKSYFLIQESQRS